MQLRGTSLAIQWLRLCASNAGGPGSIPILGTKIPHTVRHSQKRKNAALTQRAVFHSLLDESHPASTLKCSQCFLTFNLKNESNHKSSAFPTFSPYLFGASVFAQNFVS